MSSFLRLLRRQKLSGRETTLPQSAMSRSSRDAKSPNPSESERFSTTEELMLRSVQAQFRRQGEGGYEQGYPQGGPPAWCSLRN